MKIGIPRRRAAIWVVLAFLAGVFVGLLGGLSVARSLDESAQSSAIDAATLEQILADMGAEGGAPGPLEEPMPPVPTPSSPEATQGSSESTAGQEQASPSGNQLFNLGKEFGGNTLVIPQGATVDIGSYIAGLPVESPQRTMNRLLTSIEKSANPADTVVYVQLAERLIEANNIDEFSSKTLSRADELKPKISAAIEAVGANSSVSQER